MRDGTFFINSPRLLVDDVRLKEVKGSEVKFKPGKHNPKYFVSTRTQKIQLHFT